MINKMTYKGIIIQYLYDENENFHFIDGISEYKITAEKEDDAIHKMFNHYYKELWYSGEGSGDTSVEDFIKIESVDDKIKELQQHNCQFEYILSAVEADIKTQYFEL
jgi:hypothetical protein